MATIENTLLAPDEKRAIETLSHNVTSDTNVLVLNQSVSGLIEQENEQDIFTFTGSVGQILYYDALQINLSDDIRIRLIDPLGNTVFINSDADTDYPFYPPESNNFDDFNLLRLAQAGTYQLIVESNSSGTFEPSSYQFNLRDAASVPILDINQVVTLSPGEAAIYRLPANTPNIRFQSLTNNVGSTFARFYDLEGQLIAAYPTTINRPTSVPSNGGFFVLDASGVTNADYSFRLAPAADFIELNTPITETYSPGEVYVYEFNGVAGQRLYFDSLSEQYTDNVSVTVFDNKGLYYFQGNVNQDLLFGSEFPSTDTYTLVVSVSSEENNSGSFGFRLLDPKANTLSFNNPVTGSLSAGRETDVYSISGQAGQILIFDILNDPSAPISLTLQTDDPFIPLPLRYNTTSGYRYEANLLNVDFDYTLVVNGSGETDINYAFQVINFNSTDIITGTSQRDNLIGSDANNIIFSSQGSDILTGGLGRDIFRYESNVDGGDRITDFAVGIDKIDLTGVLYNLGYTGTDALADGYVQFGSRGRQGSVIKIDPDGFNGSAKDRPFIVVEGVDVASLSNPENFLFFYPQFS